MPMSVPVLVFPTYPDPAFASLSSQLAKKLDISAASSEDIVPVSDIVRSRTAAALDRDGFCNARKRADGGSPTSPPLLLPTFVEPAAPFVPDPGNGGWFMMNLLRSESESSKGAKTS